MRFAGACIVILINEGGDKNRSYSRITPAIKDARKLMKQLVWDADVTLAELKDFVDAYPTKKLVVIFPFAVVAGAVYEGKDFVKERTEEELKKDTIFLTYDSIQMHFGATRVPGLIIGAAVGKVGKRNETYKWCHHCDESYRYVHSEGTTPHECPDSRSYLLKKKSMICPTCHVIVTGRCYACRGRECRTCGSNYENNTFHTCLFMTRSALNSHFENEELDVDVDDEDEFFKPADNDYRIIIADLESAMYRVESTRQVITKFNFTEDGKYDPDGFVELDEDGEPDTDIAIYGFEHIEQRANLCYAEDGCDDSVKKMFKGENCLLEFIDWVTSYNDGKNIVLFHYGSGYDTRLIFSAAHKRYKTQLKAPIIRGTKFLELKIGNAIFRDSILHIPGSLESLGKAFKPPGGLIKGNFPILFNTVENVGKVFDTVPDLEYFAIPKDKAKYDALVKWRDEFEGPWDFDKEIAKYVIADVQVLKFVVMEFHRNVVKATGGSPWYRATAPSFVHEYLKVQVTKLMDLPDPKGPDYAAAVKDRVEDFWPILEPYEDSFARRCLRGGRTDVIQMKRVLTPEEIDRGCKILYIDVNSMYPGVQMSEQFPVGKPRIEIYDPRYVPCRKHEMDQKCGCIMLWRSKFAKFKYYTMDIQPTAEEILEDEDFFGFGCFTTIPPKDIPIALNVVFSEDEKKCLATLRDEDHVEKFETSETLKLMLANGYKLVKVHAFHRYKKAESLWKRAGFGDLIMEKMKVGGYAPESLAEREYLEAVYEERFGMGELIRNSWDDWSPDKAKKIVYKVLINSAWGKHVQRLLMTECELFNFSTDLARVYDFWENIQAGNYKFKNGTFLGANLVMNRFEKARGTVKPDLHNCYSPAAIMVPEYGRLQLVKQLMKLPEPLYHDTDSVICFYDPFNHEEIETSDILGDWGEEDVSVTGIVEYCAMGPKTYALKMKDGSTVVKAKGVNLNYATSDLVNFDVMMEIVDSYLEKRNPTVVRVGVGLFRFLLLR